MKLELPIFEHTEDGIAFGQHITRDQFILLEGAKQALSYILNDLTVNGDQRIWLATTRQKIREALECAPNIVLASLIGQLPEPHFVPRKFLRAESDGEERATGGSPAGDRDDVVHNSARFSHSMAPIGV